MSADVQKGAAVNSNLGNPAFLRTDPVAGGQNLVPAGVKVAIVAPSRPAVTASMTAALSDNNCTIKANHASVPIVITIPNDAAVAWAGENVLRSYQVGAAAVSFAAGAGVTLRTPSNLPATVQYQICEVMRIGPNEWTRRS